MITGLVYSERYLEHNLGPGHPERPERLKAIVEALKAANCWSASKTKVLDPSPTTPEKVELVHDREHVELVRRLSHTESSLDLDTPTRGNTFDLALLAAGGTIEAGETVVEGKLANAFALVRPPGHHASRARGGGFCYFNNIAIMSEVLKSERSVRRVFILDFDAHHGNGTQDIFYEDPSVLYMSLHQDGRTLYPGTGFLNEIGSGDGEGYNVNVPLTPGSSDEDYAGAMRELFVPLTEAFKPDLIAVSAGFDAYAQDPLTQLQLSTKAYGWLARHVVEQADKMCRGRVVFVLEGGYDLDALAGSIVGIVEVLAGERPGFSSKLRVPSVVRESKQLLADYWKL
ncbi:MAG: histone deacetylase [Candidatus Hadarchaeota archaeon]|nr:histone deacetylase [Candidatus Hadarchaeota archaeon]